MGRLIDADKIIFREIDEIGGEYEPYLGCSKSQINSLPTVEAIPKADYENRLKADLVAMLEEIQLEYSEYASVWMQWNDTMSKEKIAHEALKASKDKMIDLLQQKIDKLKGNKNG